MSVAYLQVPYEPHLRSPSPPWVTRRPTPKLDGALTALDNRSRSRRPGRPVIVPVPKNNTTTNNNHNNNTTTTADSSDDINNQVQTHADLVIRRPRATSTVCQIRPMMTSDLPAVADLMKDEGWNVDFDNMAAVFEMQPLAYFIAQTMSGKIVGHCSSLCLDDSVGMLSYILVRSQNQKQGVGTRLMKVAKEALGSRSMAFYSVEDAVPFYKALNFETCRFSALVRDFCLDPRDFAGLDDEDEDEEAEEAPEGEESPPKGERKEGGQKKVVVVRARNADFAKLNEYDTAVQGGTDRGRYLRQWILKPGHVTFAALDSQSGHVVGYVSLSFFRGRWDVNPLYADSDDVAMRLLKRASEEIVEPTRVVVRIPADSASGIKLFSRLRDTQHLRVLYLMSDRALPSNVNSDKVYSLSTVCYGLK